MKTYVAAGILIAAVLITAWQTYYVATLIVSGNVCGCAIPVPLYIPLFFALGVAAGIALLKIVYPSGPSGKFPLARRGFPLVISEVETITGPF